jgi:hypothetical protein
MLFFLQVMKLFLTDLLMFKILFYTGFSLEEKEKWE